MRGKISETSAELPEMAELVTGGMWADVKGFSQEGMIFYLVSNVDGLDQVFNLQIVSLKVISLTTVTFR
jgi:hypothetical protein